VHLFQLILVYLASIAEESQHGAKNYMIQLARATGRNLVVARI
jgi:hypothetical protein